MSDENILPFGTFPMWGYGFILLFLKLESKLLIIILQQLLTLVVIVYSEKTLLKQQVDSKSIFLYRVFILFSVNLFYVQTSLTPDGIALNLLALSMLFLFNYFINKKYITLIMSAIFYGLLLNFRSDFYYFQFVIIIILFFLTVLKKIQLRYIHLLIWLFIIQVLMIPWGLHTYKISGKYLQTSTNAGHTMYLSLGQLPGNKWGITPRDNDASMANILKRDSVLEIRSCSFVADNILKKEWLKNVRNDPFSYLKKCLFNLYRIARNPFYAGDIDKRFLGEEDSFNFRKEMKSNLDKGQIKKAIELLLTPPLFVFIIPFLTNIWGIFILVLFFYYLIRYLIIFKGAILYDPIILLTLLVIFYQLSILILFFFMPYYHMNVLIFYLMSIVLLYQKIKTNLKIKNGTTHTRA
jgi:hypothetical protein